MIGVGENGSDHEQELVRNRVLEARAEAEAVTEVEVEIEEEKKMMMTIGSGEGANERSLQIHYLSGIYQVGAQSKTWKQ